MELAIIMATTLVLGGVLLIMLQWQGRRQIAAARTEAAERVRWEHSRR